MSCFECKERAQLIHEAFVAYRAGDMDSYWSKLQAVAASLGQDVKVIANILTARWTTQSREQ